MFRGSLPEGVFLFESLPAFLPGHLAEGQIESGIDRKFRHATQIILCGLAGTAFVSRACPHLFDSDPLSDIAQQRRDCGQCPNFAIA